MNRSDPADPFDHAGVLGAFDADTLEMLGHSLADHVVDVVDEVIEVGHESST